MSSTSQASQRIAALLDENSFVEIGAGVTSRSTDFGLKQEDTPSDGVVTGYGVIGGNLVYVYSQDSGVLGGSVGEMHARKIAHIYDLAVRMGAPVIGIIDSTGMRLQEASDALDSLGTIYAKKVEASGVVPQISVVFGNCGGGLALIPALSDFTFMDDKKGKLFVNSPNAIKGNYEEKCDTSAASFQGAKAGLVDVAGDEGTIFAEIRNLVSMLPSNNEDRDFYEDCTDDLNRAMDNFDGAIADPALALSQLADNGSFFETKRDFAREMVTGFIKLNGATVGVIANRTKTFDEEGKEKETFEPLLTSAGCDKAASFIKFCDAFDLPILTFTGVKGFAATCCEERNIAKKAAALVMAFGTATVPKVNFVTDSAFGSAYVIMNSKADITMCWPDSRIGAMEADMAAKIIGEGKSADEISSIADQYSDLNDASKSAARRGFVDQIVDPADTRKYVVAAFEMLFTKREEHPAKKHSAK
ncbi:acyl-CoA carboxylase subunit beta [Butyrivibrio sp. MC2013]|uniref:acyl-CoA carboxylase subunit beta n=1 Tax=Butyrivibrio sp. MC2013 TaxID=1280686 RepID=UPI0003F93B3E|nr:carboxyl transferase domain-containing protein [Butyrivibrio sp. MC2013]